MKWDVQGAAIECEGLRTAVVINCVEYRKENKKGVSFFFVAFAKLRKATISFVMSVRPHGTIRLPRDEFS